MHYRVHRAAHAYMCDICDKQYNQKESLKRHLLKHKGMILENGDVYYAEPTKTVSNDSHSKTGSGMKSFKCYRCGHFIIHTGNKSNNYCSKCETITNALEMLSRINSEDLQHSPKQDKTTIPNEKPYTCDVCCEQFKESSALKEHLVFHYSCFNIRGS